jgi:hypothetical protein
LTKKQYKINSYYLNNLTPYLKSEIGECMKLKMFFIITTICISDFAIACTNDYECGYGNRCVKPSGSYSYTGSCVTLIDKYGNKDYGADSTWGSSYGLKTVDGCQWSSECYYGYKCMKESGQVYGMCMK